MSSKLKWIAIAVVAVILILIILPFLIPVNKFRPTIEAKASEALGRKVALGDMSLSILGGSLGIDNLSISDDPKFNTGAFLTAKSVHVGVELMPLIFSQQLNVTGIEIVDPQVVLLRNSSGKWNFSSLGGESTAAPASAPTSSGGNGAGAVSVGKLELKDGQISLGNTSSPKRTVYTDVNLTASDVSMSSNFPITLTMKLPGGGSLKIDGKVGPVDAKDAALTPQDVKLTVKDLNLASTGFLDPSLGLGGLVDVDASLTSHSGQMNIKGALKLSKAVLVAGGQAAGVPVTINFDTKYDLVKSAGVLNPSSVVIGNAKSNLNGTYKSEGEAFGVDMNLNGQGMPASDLEAFLPALGVNMPTGAKLTAGTLNTNLHISGPTDKLVTDGTIGLFNGKLSGFDLGQKMSAVSSLAGIKTGNDMVIEKFTSNVHMATTGLRTENMDLVVPSLGTVVGGGTIDAKNNMNFNLVATVNSSVVNGAAGAASSVTGGALGGTLGAVMGGSGSTSCKNEGMKVPLQIHGTTANPQIVPDVGGVAAGMLKSQLSCAGGASGVTKGAAGAATSNPAGMVNQLGGLLGGKKKKP